MDFEQALQELQQLYSSSSRVPGFGRRVMVDSDLFTRVINNLQTAMPADVQEAQEVLRQKDSILNQAYLEAQRVRATVEEEVSAHIAAATREHREKVSDSEVLRAAEAQGEKIREEAMSNAEDIVQDAQRRAYGIVSEAEDIAASRRDGADQYSREVLFSLEEQLSEVLGQIRRGIDTLKPSMDAPAQNSDYSANYNEYRNGNVGAGIDIE